MTNQLRFFISTLFLGVSQLLFAQENDPCSAVCLPFSGIVNNTTPPLDGASPNSFLPCGDSTSEDNPTWYIFIASGNTFNINMSVGTCSNTPSGSSTIQVTFFEGDDCSSIVAMSCLNCVDTGSLSIKTTPGKRYWIQVDGCGESVCTFTLSYLPKSILTTAAAAGSPSLTGDLVVEAGTEQTYKATLQNNLTPPNWLWTVTPSTVKEDQDDNAGTATFRFTKAGKYKICAKPQFGACISNNSKTTCINVEVKNAIRFIQGEVFLDKNEDCKRDANEHGLADRIVVINGIYTTKTGVDGYKYALPSGSYTVSTSGQNLYETVCLPPLVVLQDSATVDIPIVISAYCPYLNVDISTNILRRCQDNYYYVDYCNKGSDIAKNAYVTVDLAPNMSYKASSIPLTSQIGNQLRFTIKDVEMGKCGQFFITTFLDCNVTVSETHCVKAHIYPDSICAPAPNNYKGAKVETTAKCIGKEVVLTIKNTGTAAMTTPKNYLVVEDEEMYKQGNFKLNPKDSIQIKIPKNGKMYRIEAEQENNYPFFKSKPNAWVEACGTNAQGGISTGFVNKYSKDDYDPFTSIYCRQNVASYDPNEKMAFPTGVATPHFIEPNTDLEYELHFQNEGKDTAFLVVLRDTLDKSLDVSSLQVGSSSHQYRWDISGEGVLTFTFDKINLTTKKSDEEKSKGHVKFRIAQRQNIALGTVLKNRVGIYFDINPVILTNRVFHTIGKNFIKPVGVNTPDYQQVSVKIYPNPFDKNINFEISNFENNENEKITLWLYNISGQLLKTAFFSDNQLQLPRNDLQQGLYFYQIKAGNKVMQNGKIAAE